ncbi:hypothetical protein SAMN00120144_0759 [Hymenobacter roseosalivarius DSM 11622]|uniref:Uncharacterized protein n=1 Tax=Hymenobacter roseosalivarius DSM 11622 TaxID=645990 RepID=A0A1W1USG7_9BACT|nr:hypothetical protein [Hymenobacter roseosalivarius]SMB83674.1 hypothetical protein SAMN00120144_0759 [Hymenobacter roseosalivarius DSM 11622]
MNRLATILCCLFPYLASAQVDTDIYLVDLSVKGNTVLLSNPRNITPHKGYDNQPFFHPSLPLLYFSSSTDSSRTDLKSYNYKTAQTQQITATREREYSPLLTADQQFLSCIIQRDNGQQDLGKYPLAGGAPTILVNTLKVGYHAWIDQSRLLVYALATPSNELHYLDLATRQDTIIARNIGRSLKQIPNQSAISFLEKTAEGKWLVKRFDTNTKVISILGPALEGSEDLAWTKNGLMLMSNGQQIYAFRPGHRDGWKPVKMTGAVPGLKKASRLAINPANNQMAVVVSE